MRITAWSVLSGTLKTKDMFNRFARLITGIILLFTIPITIILFLLLWAITGEFYFIYIANWVFFNEFDNE